MKESGFGVGVGTSGPFDRMHVQFTDGTGVMTGYAVQNLSGAAGAYSGMLFYDQNRALGQFQGFNNLTHEYRINNIASGGSINFMLGTSKFLVAPSGNIGFGAGPNGLARLTVKGRAPFDATGTVTVAMGSGTVTGLGTKLLSEFAPGDFLFIVALSEGHIVFSVASDTSLTTGAWSTGTSGATANVQPAMFRADDSAGVARVVMGSGGRVGIGALGPAAGLDVNRGESTADGSNAAIAVRNSSAGGARWFLRAGATGTNTPPGA